MAIKERQGIRGRLTIELRNSEGKRVDGLVVNNVITMAGKGLLAQMFTGAAQGRPELSIAVGKGDSVASADDTALENKVDEAVATTPPIRFEEDEGEQKVVATVTATLPATGTGIEQQLSEAGVIIRLPGQDPVLYNRVTFPVVTKTENLEMAMTWEVMF